jgi:hypothetical protein
MGRDMTGGRAITGAVALAVVALAGCTSPPLSASTHSAASTGSSAPSPKSKSVFSEHSGPAHTISAPAQLDSYTRSPSLEKELNVNEVGEKFVKGSSGQASDVLSAVYAQGDMTPGAGGNQQIFMFVGGHLANTDPVASIAKFEQTYPSAQAVSAGSLGGEAACATTAANNGSAAMCVWFDNDSFGTLVSPTMSSAKLANTLDTVRPGIEQVRQ